MIVEIGTQFLLPYPFEPLCIIRKQHCVRVVVVPIRVLAVYRWRRRVGTVLASREVTAFARLIVSNATSLDIGGVSPVHVQAPYIKGQTIAVPPRGSERGGTHKSPA